MQHPLSWDLGLGFDTHKPRWWKRGSRVSQQITAQTPSCLNREWLFDHTQIRRSCAVLSVCLSPECFWGRLTASQLFVYARSCHHPAAGSHIIINTSSCNIQGNKVGYFHSYPVLELCDWLPPTLLCTPCCAVLRLAGCVGWLLLLGQQWTGWMNHFLSSLSLCGICAALRHPGRGANLKGLHLMQQWHAEPYC